MDRALTLRARANPDALELFLVGVLGASVGKVSKYRAVEKVLAKGLGQERLVPPRPQASLPHLVDRQNHAP